MYKDENIPNAVHLPHLKTDPAVCDCNGCNICKKECAFLSKYGNPKEIEKQVQDDPDKWHAIAFECSLCGLCNAVCPQKVDASAMFLDLRVKAFNKGKANFAEHQGILNYEKKGTSKKFSFYSLPENCDTIFFPGCTLPGTRPKITLKTYEYLKEKIEHIGVVLDCCMKPSHDLGRHKDFLDMLIEMKTFLRTHQINTIIVACPNCHKIFDTYAPEFKVQTVYEVMAAFDFKTDFQVNEKVIVHDPCPVRFKEKIQIDVRTILKKQGIEFEDIKHSRTKTVCCGEGGSVGCLSPELASGWANKMTVQAQNRPILTYCAGCVNFLSKKSESYHILDLAFDPENTAQKKARVSKAPFTYLNRLKLKNTLKKEKAAVTRERTFSAMGKNKSSIPLFPFNLLNYALGFTRIKFSHYIVTTFICMLSACVAFTVFQVLFRIF
ncbi:MAG: (Fe-S)-binding protein [Desulfobacteraceae bacterium]|nr:(Fe-S)-binding protein [Desulfobacteraceae bacterium]